MAQPLSDDERDRILTLARHGKSCAEIAITVGRGKSTVSRACKAAGVTFDRAQTRAATEAKRADNASRRQDLARKFIDAGHVFLDQVLDSGRLTPHKAQALMVSAGIAAQRHAELERFDSSDGADDARSMLTALADGLAAANRTLNPPGEE